MVVAVAFARAAARRALLRSASCAPRVSMSSSAGGGGEQPRQFSLPTADAVKRATFEQAIRIGSSVCAAMQEASTGPPGSPLAAELGPALRAMLSTSDGARGFFSVYLTNPALAVADAELVPRPLVLALNGAPPDAHRALIRMLVASTASWSSHRVLDQEGLARLSALTSARSGALLLALESPRLLDTLLQLRAACRVRASAGKGPRDAEADSDSAEAGLPAPPPVPAGEEAPPTWAQALVTSAKHSPEQLLAIGVALDRLVHQRLAAGDSSWRALPQLQPALASAAAALGGRSGVDVRSFPNGLLQITLARGAQLNALNAAMLGEILDAATSAASPASSVRAVLLRSDDERAFSAGGDVRALTAERQWEGRTAILQLEYAAVAALARLAREMPVVAIADGVAMGAGLGLFMAANRRLVSCSARLGMPECAIGLIPDAATVHHLTALPPGFVGMYCALTGAALGAADALYAGLGTAHLPAGSVAALEARLREQPLAGLDASLAALCQPMEERSRLSRLQAKLDAVFGQSNLEQVGGARRSGVGPWRAPAQRALRRAVCLAPERAPPLAAPPSSPLARRCALRSPARPRRRACSGRAAVARIRQTPSSARRTTSGSPRARPRSRRPRPPRCSWRTTRCSAAISTAPRPTPRCSSSWPPTSSCSCARTLHTASHASSVRAAGRRTYLSARK